MSASIPTSKYFAEPARGLWERAAPTERFHWRLNGRLLGLVLLSQGLLWSYWGYTVVELGFTTQLLLFAAVYSVLAAWLGVLLLRFRAFCLQSAVVFHGDRIVWCHSGVCYEARLRDIKVGELGLDQIGNKRELDARLLLPQSGGQPASLWLWKGFGHLDGVERLVASILERAGSGRS